MKVKLTRDLTTKLLVTIVAAIGFVAYWKFLNPPPTQRFGFAPCLSRVKQLGTALAMYGSDNDDAYPPYFTFLSEQSRDKFIESTVPYAKNHELYVCNQDPQPKEGLAYSNGKEESPKAMSYVHPQSLKGHIPSYSAGNRVLFVSEIADPGSTPYLRDPIRGYGDDEKLNPKYTGFLSAHGGLFSMGFADTHAKATRLDINRGL